MIWEIFKAYVEYKITPEPEVVWYWYHYALAVPGFILGIAICFGLLICGPR